MNCSMMLPHGTPGLDAVSAPASLRQVPGVPLLVHSHIDRCSREPLELTASVPTSIAFQWSDAAVGAGSSLVIVGLAIGGYFVLRRRHLHVRVT